MHGWGLTKEEKRGSCSHRPPTPEPTAVSLRTHDRHGQGLRTLQTPRCCSPWDPPRSPPHGPRQLMDVPGQVETCLDLSAGQQGPCSRSRMLRVVGGDPDDPFTLSISFPTQHTKPGQAASASPESGYTADQIMVVTDTYPLQPAVSNPKPREGGGQESDKGAREGSGDPDSTTSFLQLLPH